jgi:hypothetical protein
MERQMLLPGGVIAALNSINQIGEKETLAKFNRYYHQFITREFSLEEFRALLEPHRESLLGQEPLAFPKPQFNEVLPSLGATELGLCRVGREKIPTGGFVFRAQPPTLSERLFRWLRWGLLIAGCLLLLVALSFLFAPIQQLVAGVSFENSEVAPAPEPKTEKELQQEEFFFGRRAHVIGEWQKLSTTLYTEKDRWEVTRAILIQVHGKDACGFLPRSFPEAELSRGDALSVSQTPRTLLREDGLGGFEPQRFSECGLFYPIFGVIQ